MQRMRTHIAMAAVLALVGAVPAAADPTGELVVRFDPATTMQQRAAALDAAGVTPTGAVSLTSAAVVEVEGDTTRREALEVLRGRPEVRWVEPNLVYRALAVPDDPLLGRQWSLRNTGQEVEGLAGVPGADIGAVAGWERGTGDPAVNVAIVDSGMALDHPDLAPNLSATVQPRDEIDGDAVPTDLEGHGTAVAGIVGARGNDGTGMAGVAWRVGLVPIRVLDGNGGGSSVDIANGFRYASQRGVRLVNASLGGPTSSAVIADAIAAGPGTLFVVAAGNEGEDVDSPGGGMFPCALPLDNILCVASTDQSDRLAEGSNYGARSVDVAAPGKGITGPEPAFRPPAFADDFESGLAGRWTVTPGGSWGVEAVPGGAALSDSPGGPYTAFASTAVTSAPFSLAGGVGCRLSMRLRIATAAGDGMIADASSNGVDWTPLGSYTGSSDGRFRRVSEYMGALDGAPVVRLRLRFLANSGVGADGVTIDDLRVACLGGAYDGDEYVMETGTSFAAPHVTGVAAVIMSRYPQLSVAQVKQAILQGATRLPSLNGRVVSGGRLSFAGALDAAAALAGAPPVAPAGAGIANARFTMRKPERRRGVWSVEVGVPRPALTEVVFERRRPGTGVAGVRARWLLVRTDGPRDRVRSFRYRMGRLGRGVYRVTVLLPEERRVLRRVLTVRVGR